MSSLEALVREAAAVLSRPFQRRKVSPPGGKGSASDEAWIVAMWRERADTHDIAQVLGLRESAVYNVIARQTADRPKAALP